MWKLELLGRVGMLALNAVKLAGKLVAPENESDQLKLFFQVHLLTDLKIVLKSARHVWDLLRLKVHNKQLILK